MVSSFYIAAMQYKQTYPFYVIYFICKAHQKSKNTHKDYSAEMIRSKIQGMILLPNAFYCAFIVSLNIVFFLYCLKKEWRTVHHKAWKLNPAQCIIQKIEHTIFNLYIFLSDAFGIVIIIPTSCCIKKDNFLLLIS